MLTVSITISSRRESAYKRAFVPAIPSDLLAAHAAVHMVLTLTGNIFATPCTEPSYSRTWGGGQGLEGGRNTRHAGDTGVMGGGEPGYEVIPLR